MSFGYIAPDSSACLAARVWARPKKRGMTPPSTGRFKPLMKLASSLARNAMTLGARPSRIRSAWCLSNSGNRPKGRHVQLGEGNVWTDRINSHTTRAEFDGQTAREITRCALWRRCRSSSLDHRQVRTHVDDRSLGLDEMWQSAASHVECTIDVDREHTMPFPDRHIQKSLPVR